MLLSIGLILLLGFLGGYLASKIKIPGLVMMIVVGLIIGPYALNLLDQSLLDISSYLRQIALVIILTRSGLNLDFSSLKKMGRPALLMSFVPASLEIIGVNDNDLEGAACTSRRLIRASAAARIFSAISSL